MHCNSQCLQVWDRSLRWWKLSNYRIHVRQEEKQPWWSHCGRCYDLKIKTTWISLNGLSWPLGSVRFKKPTISWDLDKNVWPNSYKSYFPINLQWLWEVHQRHFSEIPSSWLYSMFARCKVHYGCPQVLESSSSDSNRRIHASAPGLRHRCCV